MSIGLHQLCQQGTKLPPGYKRRINRSVDGKLESYGPYKQRTVTATYKKVVLKIAGHCNFEGPLRLFICTSMAPRWSSFCDREPRYNLSSVGHSKPWVLTRSFKGIQWCYSLPLLYFWGVFSGYGWACRLCACVWHQAGLCKVSRDWSLWWIGRHFLQPWFWSSVCGSCGPYLWQPSWVQLESSWLLCQLSSLNCSICILHPWFCGLYPSRHAGWQDCQLANPTWWLQVHIPVELQKLWVNTLMVLIVWNGWWGAVCYWNKEKFLWRWSWLQARLVVTSKSAWPLSSACLGYRENWLMFSNDDRDDSWSTMMRTPLGSHPGID